MAADEATTRLEDVQRVTEAALAYLDLDDLLDALLQRVTDILHADTAAVLLVEDDGRTLAARAAKGLEEEVERGFHLPIGRGFAGRVAATRQPVVIPDLDDSSIEVVNPLMREKRVRSLLGVPLIVEGKVVGVLHVGTLTPRDFQEGDVQLLQLVADRVALSIERSRLAVQGQIAQTLQRSLLPRRLPQLPGVSMAAWYEPAAEETAVGGDWYDVIELGHRRLGLTIGDVAGHGLAAAIHMGQLRMATMVYATVNLDTWVVDCARAGHPYPLLIRADGSGTFLSDAGGPPLGTGAVETYDEQRITLAPGETLLLYTDGLIERRGSTLTEGESALVEAATAAPDEPELKCRSIIERLTEGIAVPDDVAVVAVRAVGRYEPMEVQVPAEAEQLAIVRHLIRRWVSAHGGTDDDCAAFAIAVTEACANAVEHAYGPGDAKIRLGAVLEDGEATVTVRDSGWWREPRGRNRGRGIRVMKEFMDDVAIDAGDDGTTVELRRRIGGE